MADHSAYSSISDVLRQLKVQELKRLADAELMEQFTSSGDEAAFNALVSRHGPTVLGVCRRVLRSAADVDDAFQATFLALAKQAGSIRCRVSVGAWLYEVAYNTALKARARRARTQQVEHASSTDEAVWPADELNYQDLQRVLDEELHRLPERVRQALVLVHLLGNTQVDAARELGISDRALRKRLQAGRQRLRLRLNRRGVAMTAAALTIGLDLQAIAGPVPPSLFRPTVESVLAYASGKTGAVPASTVNLAMAGVGGLLAQQFKLICLLAAVSTVAALVFAAYATTSGPPASLGQIPDQENAPIGVDKGRSEILTGRVFAADGRPLPYASVTALVRKPWQPAGRGLRDETLASASTDAQGRYRFAVPVDFHTWYPDRQLTLLAHANGHAPITGTVQLRGRPTPTDLRLPGGAAVRGLLLAPDGRPASGVRLAVVRLGKAIRESTQGEENSPAPPGWPVDVISGTDGGFQLSGLPIDENLWLQVQDDRYASSTFRVPPGTQEPFTVTLTGPRLLTGQVVAQETGRYLAGARLSVFVGPWQKHHDHYTVLAAAPEALSAAPLVELSGRADSHGKFRMRLPPESAYRIYVYPPEGSAYLGQDRNLAWAEGENGRELQVALPAGVAVHGRVMEEDGSPVNGACVSYEAANSSENPPSLSDMILFRNNATTTDADGHFQIVVPTGPCQLNVFGRTAEYELYDYTLQPCRSCGFKHVRTCEHGRVALQLDAGARPDPIKVIVRRGKTIIGRVVGPDGEAIREGVMVCRTIVHPLRNTMPRALPIRDGSFELPGCVAGRTYPVLILDAVRRLAAVADLHLPAEGEAITTIRLAPCGTAEVRLVDSAGRPLAGHRPFIHFWLGHDRPAGEPVATNNRLRPDPIYPSWVDPLHYLHGPTSDEQGLVVLPAVVPGLEYDVDFLIGERRQFRTQLFRVNSGQVLRLPDVVAATDAEAGLHGGEKP